MLSLDTLKSRFEVFPNHFLVAKVHKRDDNEIIGFVNGMVTDEETITDEMYTNAKLHQLIPFYEQFGFQNLGISKSTHGGVVWYDMLLNI